MSDLKGKKILISAGPTWVPIDQVRVITNIFGGTLGYVIAQAAARAGAEVTLLMGPGRTVFSGGEKFAVKRFKYYDEIYKLLEKEVGSKKYDVLIHSAAIPDYVPKTVYRGKIKSGNDNFVLRFKTTKKIVDQVKKWDKDIFLVKFKLEVGLTEKQLIETAYQALKKSKAELIVANELEGISKNHRAFIIDAEKKVQEVVGKKKIAEQLLRQIGKRIV